VSTTRLPVTGTVNPVPTITHVSNSGDASQIATQNLAIPAIVYSATTSATISMTGGAFPSNISGYPSGTSYTISGTPLVTGTFGYSLTASANGCTSADAVGTIAVNADVPLSAASTQTWVFGSRTWSDRIVAKPADCTQTSTLSTETYPPAQYIVHDGQYYYNWSCVDAAGNALCASMSTWRVPNYADLQTIAGTPLNGVWPTVGQAMNYRLYSSGYGFIWSTRGYIGVNDNRASTLDWATSSSVATISDNTKSTGLQVRCVK
jgi:hypothetical protein